jgi:hypothetical protein
MKTSLTVALMFLVGTLATLAVVAGTTVEREVCVHRARDNVTTGSWAFSPLAWFSSSTDTPNEHCELETLGQYGAGQINDGIERSLGGPHFGEYYSDN